MITSAKRLSLIVLLLTLSACTFNLSSIFKLSAEPLHLTVKVLAKFPHDTAAYTEGLLFADDKLYESVGNYVQPAIREVDPQTGKVLRGVDLPKNYFGEGLALVDNRFIQLTWKEKTAFIYDRESLTQIGAFSYAGQGWGLCYDGTQLYMSDGSSMITVRDPKTFAVIRRFQVIQSGKPIDQLNELECVDDSLYENVWFTNNILKIDKATGHVTAVIDASGLLTPEETEKIHSTDGVLNGIAYNPQKQDFWITGKLWPWMFEVQFVPSN
jgi:glutaminyl-peptide cyclotransferase